MVVVLSMAFGCFAGCLTAWDHGYAASSLFARNKGPARYARFRHRVWCLGHPWLGGRGVAPVRAGVFQPTNGSRQANETALRHHEQQPTAIHAGTNLSRLPWRTRASWRYVGGSAIKDDRRGR